MSFVLSHIAVTSLMEGWKFLNYSLWVLAAPVVLWLNACGIIWATIHSYRWRNHRAPWIN
jgi:hypothetical protein